MDRRRSPGRPGVLPGALPLSGPRLPDCRCAGSLRPVDLSSYRRMDPHLLVGLLNTELRNHCDTLDDLVKTHHLEPDLLEKKMADAGYVYQPEQNQFR